MAAVVAVQWDFGGTDNSPGTTGAAVTNLRFNAEDTNDQDAASPLIIPGSPGVVYSFWKQIYLKATTGPDTQIDNMKLFTDGTLGWGTEVQVNVGNGTQVHSSTATTGYEVADAQEVMTAHADVAATTSLFTFTDGSERTVTISETSSQIDATNETTDYIVLNCQIDDDSTQGTKATETVTWEFDEI